MYPRLFEIIPGALGWLTLILMVVLSWKIPFWVAIFIILFDIYWLLKAIYLSFHLRSTFRGIRENLSIDWLARLREERKGEWEKLWHVVILPMHQEPYEIVAESFDSLCRANYPLDRFIVVLALEERAGAEAQETGRRIREAYGGRFHSFLVTTHPAGIPGELAGKGSNQAWAAKRLKEEVIDREKLSAEDILVSVFDIDTQIFSDYFSRLAYVFLSSPNRWRAIYQPVPLFTNNIYQAPALARVIAFSCTFWQMMQQARPERLTSFSSQSLPWKVLADIGFWQTHLVSEDSRIFWQAFLHYHGDFRVEPLLYPVSMDANVAPTWWGTMRNLYRQQRRWAWGAENIPYMLEGFRTDPAIPRGKKWYWTFNVLEGFHSWATNSLMIFALGWLPLMLGGRAFNDTLLSYNLPNLTRFIISLSMLGIATSAVMAVALLPPRPKWFRPWHSILYIVQWALIPITLIIFGAFPGLEAQTRLMLGGRFRLGFWVTPKGRYPKTAEGDGEPRSVPRVGE
jgi:hypothetical protein